MVCIHCSQETRVINSRVQRRANRVWRRRHCQACAAIFTTLESPDYEASWLVRRESGQVEPFVRDRLFLSLYTSCQHRANAIRDAAALTDTVIRKLLSEVHEGTISLGTIAATAQVALARFDTAASVHYRAFYGPKTD